MFISAVLYVLAETPVVMLQASLRSEVARCTFQVWYTLVKGSILVFICLYTLWAAAVDYKSTLAQKNATLGSVIFPATVFSK